MNRETPRRFATSMSVNVVLPDGFANDATDFTSPLDSMFAMIASESDPA